MTEQKLTYSYYHQRLQKAFQFIIPKSKKVLFYGLIDGSKLSSLSPSYGLGIEPNISTTQTKHKKISIKTAIYEKYKPRRKYDYIVLNATLGKTYNIMQILKNIQPACTPYTRIIIYQHNHLWQGLLKLLEKFNLKRKDKIYNWLSVSDVSNYLKAAGFETTRIFRHTLFPLKLFGIGTLINFLGIIFPLLDFFKLDQFIICRPLAELFPQLKSNPSLTICITVRDEKENIEPIVNSIPKFAKKQEIIFVEGHSKDGTKEEILRVNKKYPKKNVRLLVQPKIGQGDATLYGFSRAKGEIIIIYEGDQTADPKDIKPVYEAMARKRFEFILGSRLVYPLSTQQMPAINKLGNMLFAKWFSFFLGQRSTDVLCGIKAINKKDFDVLSSRWGHLGVNDPFGDFELLFGAARMGLKIGEIPVRYYPRTYGETKTSVFHHGWYLLIMALNGYWLFRKN